MLRKNIVIIDDDPSSIDGLEEFLKSNDFRVSMLPDGRNGLDAVQREKPDLVICDMLIPGIHGLELCKKITADPALTATKIVLMTAVYKGMKYQFEAKTSGASALWTKPLEFKEVLDKVQELLHIAPKQREPEPKNPPPPEAPAPKKKEKRESLKKLDNKFIAALPGEIKKIRGYAKKIEKDTQDKDSLFELARKVHSLSGTGAMYGYLVLAETARTIDQLLNPIIKQDRVCTKAERGELQVMLDVLAAVSKQLGK